MSFFKAATVLALAAAASATAATVCPGTTTTQTLSDVGPTVTQFSSTFYDGVFVDCGGAGHIEVFPKGGPIPITTITEAGVVTSPSYMCSPSTACPTLEPYTPTPSCTCQ